MSTTIDPAGAFGKLCAYLSEIGHIQSVAHLTAWDQETYMPPAGGPARAQQAAAMAAILHDRRTSAELGDLIEACESEQPNEASADAACLREVRRDYERATRLPRALVTEFAEVGSRSQDAWKGARKASDFAMFRPWLEKMVGLAIRKAECLKDDARHGELYDALLDEFEPGARAAEIEAVFTPLGAKLSALVSELLENGTAPDTSPRDLKIPEAAQHALGLEVVEAMGFDLGSGRLDTTTHPFCQTIGPGDVRLTTRYGDDRFTDSLYGTMHEAGHGLYEQGLAMRDASGEPSAVFGTPLADAVSLGIHESQSRMWENFVGRSRAFWTWAKPAVDRHFGEASRGFSEEEMFRAVNTVERSFIRVEADEATYNLHVMLRFEIERALISGDLAVADLPGVWNENFERLLGAKVPDDRRGCLQDVHWSFGLMGYFPTYTLGNLYAAQFWEAIGGAVPDLDAKLAAGDFAPVLAWNREHIHAHGRRYSAGELCERATGKPLGEAALLRHLEGKLRPVFGL